MKISASYLSIKDNIEENIKRLDNSKIDYIHVDVMDGMFVPNKTLNFSVIKDFLNNHTKNLDIHLMVNDVYGYIDKYAKLNPEFITFHYEVVDDPYLVIDYIKSYGIKAGISIKPNTDISVLDDLLDYVDLILVMSVEPGKGGQKFLDNTKDRLQELISFKKDNDFEIYVDGGINDETIKEVLIADGVISGSFICMNKDFENQIMKLKNSITQ